MLKFNKNHILLFGLILLLLPYCYLCFFSNPSADDFSLAAQAQQNDFFDIILREYKVRNGRYISSPISFLNPIAFNSYLGYKVVPLLLILFIWLGSFFLLSQLLVKKGIHYKVIGALLFVLLFFHNMPIISEGIYWYTGSVIYSLGAICSLLYCAVFIRVVRLSKDGVWLGFLTFLLLISCGFNEVLTLLIVFLLGMISIVFYQKNLKCKRIVLYQFLLSIVFASILILAPGNAVRGSSYPDAHQFLHSFGYSILQVVRFAFLWVVSVPLIASSVLYFWINKKLVSENDLFGNSFYLNRGVSLFLLFSIVFICVFPAYWATGILGQHRTLNIAYFFFLMMWFVNLTVWLNYYKRNFTLKLSGRQKTGVLLILVFGLCFTGNGYNALHDIFSGSAKAFDVQHVKRFEKLSESHSDGRRELILDPITFKPKCLFTYDITNNPRDWKNYGYNLYFKLGDVDVVLEDN